MAVPKQHAHSKIYFSVYLKTDSDRLK